MAFTKYSSTAASNTAAPPNGAPEGQAPSTVNDCLRDMMAETRLLGDQARGPLNLLGSVSGTNTITASSTPTLPAYAAGQRFVFAAAGANTTGVTLNINSLGAINIYKGSGATALVAGDIPSGSIVEVIYLTSPGNHFRLMAVSPGALTGGTIQIGMGMDFWGTTATAGWLFAYGQAISRTTYSALFAVFSTTFGTGDGSTTFNMPDKRGRASFGKDNMGGSSADRITAQTGGWNGDTLGAAGGTETHTLDATQIPAHTHGLATSGNLSAGGGATRVSGGGSDTNSGSTGGGGAHNNLPPGIVCNYIVYAGA